MLLLGSVCEHSFIHLFHSVQDFYKDFRQLISWEVVKACASQSGAKILLFCFWWRKEDEAKDFDFFDRHPAKREYTQRKRAHTVWQKMRALPGNYCGRREHLTSSLFLWLLGFSWVFLPQVSWLFRLEDMLHKILNWLTHDQKTFYFVQDLIRLICFKDWINETLNKYGTLFLIWNGKLLKHFIFKIGCLHFCELWRPIRIFTRKMIVSNFHRFVVPIVPNIKLSALLW